MMSPEPSIPSSVSVDTDVCQSAILCEIGIDICKTIQAVKRQLLTNDVRPEISCQEDFGRGWCRYIATDVYDQLNKRKGVNILFSGSMGGNHFWIEYNGQHFDAEKPCGVDHWRDLPAIQRYQITGEPTNRTNEVGSF